MMRLAGLAGCLAGAICLFLFATVTPQPIARIAPVQAFSALRAMDDVRQMAPTPHPVGSPANERVRDYLMARMAALGLSPRIQRDESHRSESWGGERYIGGADVENVIGILRGRDPTLPALLLMAHRDSVPGSPGAADDIAGVATVLEIVRAIKATGAPARDVIVAITDGEEAGLLGANAFFADDPIASHVGFVINLEARGGGGRANMFETGANNGGAIDLFAKTAMRPASTSLSVFVYKLLPNDTDFTIARGKGLPGLNYAFIGRQFDYHSPSSTIAVLDQGSVQHMGDEVLGTASAIATTSTLPARSPDKVYADVLGQFVIAYPPWGGWLVLTMSAVLTGLGAYRAAQAGEIRIPDVVKGVVAMLLLVVISALVLAAIRYLTGAGFGFLEQRPLLARLPLFEVAMAAGALGSILTVAALLSGGRTRLSGVWSGLLLTALVAAAALQASAPTIAFVIAWPAVVAGGLSALTAAGSARGRLVWGLYAVATTFITAWLLVLFHSLMQGLDVPEAPAIIVWLAALALWPLASPRSAGAWRFAPAVSVLVIGICLALFMRLTSPWTARFPQAAEPIYVVAPRAGRAWIADAVAPGTWSQTWLKTEGGRPAPLAIPGLSRSILASPAPPVDMPSPVVSLSRGAGGLITLRVRPASGAASLHLDISCDTILGGSTFNGRPVDLAAPGRWTHVRWEAGPEGFTLSFTPVGPGRLSLRWTQYTPQWPSAAHPVPPMPADVMAWDRAGSTAVVGAEIARL